MAIAAGGIRHPARFGGRYGVGRALLSVLVVLVVALATLLLAPVPRATSDTAPQDPSDPRTPVTVSADGLPTAQIDGVVWSQAIIGDVVYAGGSFTTARPAGAAAGTSTVSRNNMLAYNVRTGELVTSFAPSFNAQVRAVAVSPDRTRIYVGGDFTTINGISHRRIAAFDAATGALLASFNPPMNYHVNALVATNTTVYAGGEFQDVGTQVRQGLAAFNAANGALLAWTPSVTGGDVWALAINPEGTKIAVGGSFTALNGSSDPGYCLGMVDAATGAALPFLANSIIRDATADGAITTLTADSEFVYGGGYTYGRIGGTWEGTFSASWADGSIHWADDCHGDTYSLHVQGDVVYAASHTHYCENIDGIRQGAGNVGDYPYFRATAFGRNVTGTVTWEPDQGRYYNFEGQPRSSMLTWYPSLNAGTYTGQVQGPWSVTGNADFVAMGGEFTRVNGRAQQGLVRFARPGMAPNSQGPSLYSSTYPLKVRSTEEGTVRLSWATNQDIDNDHLTYRLYRDSQSGAGLIQSRSSRASWWNPYGMGYTDTGLDPGSTHRYRVAVSDPYGNIANSPWTEVTVASAGTDSAYVDAVEASEPTHWWRFDEPSGTTVADAAGFQPLTATATGATLGAPGALLSDPGSTAIRLAGSTATRVNTTVQDSPPDVFTLEAWFRTAGTAGGKLVGRGNRIDRNSSKVDRQLYLDDAGHVLFGVKPNQDRQVVTSPDAYNDGAWHLATASLSPEGMRLYVDGALVGARSDVTVGEHLALGYWRVGGDSLSRWPSLPANSFFAGDLDEVAVYYRPLGETEIAAHYVAGVTGNLPPVASFETTIKGLTATFASTSTDADGTIVGQEWEFGDGATSTEASPEHAYAVAGTYAVTLTVTDDDGATGTVTQEVTVTEPIPPVASFETTIKGLTVTFASTSTDADGTIVSHEWEFGDGGTSSAVSPQHSYAVAGTYTVTLTVTDDDGATGTVTQEVTVTEPVNVPPVASFGSTVDGSGVTFASTSTDADGTIVSHEWAFGDGGTSSAVSPQHSYAVAGTYTVTLTVTDDDGATGTVTQEVTVAPGAVTPFAVDEFERTVVDGWGSADVGGAWTRSGSATNFSVADGVGRIRMSRAGAGPGMVLSTISSTDTDLQVRVGADKAATGGGIYLTVQPRLLSAGDGYFADVRLVSGGAVALSVARSVGGVETSLRSRTVTGLTYVPGTLLNVRVQAVGTAPTTVRAKVWADGDVEPDAWTVTATDTTVPLQAPGAIGLYTYLSGSATNAPVLGLVDQLRASPA